MAATSTLTTRHNHLRSVLPTHDLEGLVINPGPSMHFLTGLDFHLMERPVLVFFPVSGSPAIVLPELEKTKLAGLPFDLKVLTYNENPTSWPVAFSQAFAATGLRGSALGVEPRSLRFLELDYLQQSGGGATFTSGESVLADLRMRKDATELNHMERATKIAQDALKATLPALQVGVTERVVASELIAQLLRHGSDPELPFFPIVCFGVNSANPHYTPGDVALKDGDLILIDWGARWNGYASDLTRMFVKGSASEKLARITEIVREANAAGRAQAAPGVSAGSVDRACRKHIADAGFGEYFVHRTGHGLGLETHEDPYIRDDNEQLLETGMTFTIEPGIYLPGEGGARIEDDMVITKDGARSLSTLPRELVAV